MPDDDLRADVEAFIDAYQGKRFGAEMQRVADRILRRRDRAPLLADTYELVVGGMPPDSGIVGGFENQLGDFRFRVNGPWMRA